SSAMLLRRTLRIAAKQFYYHNNTPAYQQSLRAIQRKAENRKSRVAHVLREMLVKSEKLV
ncbi:MAG UNVERIFIED_CONTAM: hypothetical protein MIK85_25090, partial [Klebsiella quasipneumoniae]